VFVFMTSKERLTSQKKIIIDFLKSTKSHPTAESIYQAVKKKLPQISLSTVYRILNDLKEKGKIIEVFNKKGIHFDGDTSNHSHFFCSRCHKIYDIYDKFNLKPKNKIGQIKDYKIYFYGICKKCLKK